MVTISKSPNNTPSYSRRLELRHIFSFCGLGKWAKQGVSQASTYLSKEKDKPRTNLRHTCRQSSLKILNGTAKIILQKLLKYTAFKCFEKCCILRRFREIMKSVYSFVIFVCMSVHPSVSHSVRTEKVDGISLKLIFEYF